MAKGTRTQLRKRRHVRVRKRIAGTGDRPRLNVFRSLNQIYASIIDDSMGHTLTTASTLDKDLRPELTKMNKTDQAKQVGKLIAERAKKLGVRKVVFDRGGYRYHGRVKALAEAAREAGLEY